jgi:hypothetical protein
MTGTTSSLGRRGFLRSLVSAAFFSQELLGQIARNLPETQPGEGAIEFESSDTALADGFRWAKAQALAYVRDSPEIGPWYEAALPGRNAFCMGDVSHMSTGAQLLALGPNNRNKRREYPEVSYTVIGNLGAGLMGIHPSSRSGEIETYPQLTSKTNWAAMHHVPIGRNVISVKHTHAGATTFSDESGSDVVWRASLPGKLNTLFVDGNRVAAGNATRSGGMVESFHTLEVGSGQTRVVSVLPG